MFSHDHNRNINYDFEDEKMEIGEALRETIIENFNDNNVGMWLSKEEINKRIDEATEKALDILVPNVYEIKPAPVKKPVARKPNQSKPKAVVENKGVAEKINNKLGGW